MRRRQDRKRDAAVQKLMKYDDDTKQQGPKFLQIFGAAKTSVTLRYSRSRRIQLFSEAEPATIFDEMASLRKELVRSTPARSGLAGGIPESDDSGEEEIFDIAEARAAAKKKRKEERLKRKLSLKDDAVDEKK
jgi:hypothetical protein